jgi:hypothetical protein
MNLFNNITRLKEALKIQADREYKQLIEKAVSLDVTDFDYSTYDPQGLRHKIGEKLNEIAVNENRNLRMDFYNVNSRGC